MEVKRPSDSFTIMNELVLPNDTNMLNNLMGGRLLHWMDIVAAIAAQKHSGFICVTAAVNNVSFNHAIKLGDVVTLQAKVVRSFNSSMEVYIDVFATNLITNTKHMSNEAFYTFVALDKDGNKMKVPPIQPLTDDEFKLYEFALMRKQQKLLLSGKITLKEAPELKKLYQSYLDGDSPLPFLAHE